MRKMLMASVLAIAAVVGSSSRADAWSWGHTGPWPQTAAFPCVNPPGWYSNTYSYAWQYPWFAYYNYSHGPYANWMAGGGYAYYKNCGNCGPQGCGLYGPTPLVAPPVDPHHPVPKDKKPADVKKEPGKVTIELPADAKLLFNGAVATGTGATRTFATPALAQGQDYGYELTAEVVRDGRVQTVTERVIVRAGETAKVSLNPGGIVTTSAK
jgi:uncharacterized protein (TIGR03000 family)